MHKKEHISFSLKDGQIVFGNLVSSNLVSGNLVSANGRLMPHLSLIRIEIHLLKDYGFGVLKFGLIIVPF